MGITPRMNIEIIVPRSSKSVQAGVGGRTCDKKPGRDGEMPDPSCQKGLGRIAFQERPCHALAVCVAARGSLEDADRWAAALRSVLGQWVRAGTGRRLS